MKVGMNHLKSVACAISVALAMLVEHAHAQQVPIPGSGWFSSQPIEQPDDFRDRPHVV
jgi:hypothetical protein